MVKPLPTLREWSFARARLPLLATFVGLLVLEGLFLWVLADRQQERQKETAERLAGLVQLALSQQNPELLQSGLEWAKKDLRADRALVCEKARLYVTKKPQDVFSCPLANKALTRLVAIPLHGKQGLFFVVEAPLLPERAVVLWTALFSLLVCGAVVLALRFFQRSLARDILNPIRLLLTNGGPMSIAELENLRLEVEAASRLRLQEAIAERNVKLAHDIRSPLNALVIAAEQMTNVSVSARELMLSAMDRIQGIASGLLQEASTNRVSSLGPFLERLVAEKRAEHASIPGFDLVLSLSPEVSGLPSPLSDIELGRALSNLINNAVEAKGQGPIVVRADAEAGQVFIEVQDQGEGMPLKLLSQLKEGHVVTTKAAGHGLGLKSVRDVLRPINGHLSFASEPGQGTKITLTLPLQSAAT